MEVREIATGQILQIPDVGKYPTVMGWLPDGASFLIHVAGPRIETTWEDGTFFLGTIDGTSEELNFQTEEQNLRLSSLAFSDVKSLWLGSGTRYLTFRRITHNSETPKRVTTEAYVVDFESMVIEKVAEYDQVYSARLGAIPFLLP